MATRVLPGIITRFCETRPQVRLLLTGRSSVFMVDWVTAQRVDLGISVLSSDRPGLSCHLLLRMEAVCVLPVGHHLAQRKVLTPRQIAAEPLISLSTEDKARFMVDQFFESANVRSKTAIETQMSESACQFVAEGVGISIVDPLSTLGFRPDQIVVKSISSRILFDIWLIVPTIRPSSLLTTTFIQFFSEEIKKILRKNNFYFMT